MYINTVNRYEMLRRIEERERVIDMTAREGVRKVSKAYVYSK